MKDDVELLREYAQTQSEDAFAELVRRHLPLVYSAALRQVGGDQALAKDVAQTVFIDLARKAASLSRRPLLTGWLYTSTRFAASNAVRQEQRRRVRERKAIEMQEPFDPSAPEPAWEALSPVLDEAMAQLDVTDRNAVLLRFFERKQLKTVGAALEMTEDAARMRISRALEKLRILLKQRGVAISATALSAALAEGAVGAAPAGLAPAVSAAALAGAAAGVAVLPAIRRVLTTSKAKAGIIGAIVVAGVVVPLALKRHREQPQVDVAQQIAALPTVTVPTPVAPLAVTAAPPSQPEPPQPLTSTLIEPTTETSIPRPALEELPLPGVARPGQPPAPPVEPRARLPRLSEEAPELRRAGRRPLPPATALEPAQIALPGITNPAVQTAIGKVPHSAFVFPEALTNASRRTMESPYVVAYVAECLDPQPTDHVLQLGVGSGYETAVLAELVQAVYSVEPRAEILRQARANLERCGYTNKVFVRQGELAAGWLETSPFDKMVFNGSRDQFPTALMNQLKQGGRLVIVADEDNQIHVFEKTAEGLISSYNRPVSPVPTRPPEVGMLPNPEPLTIKVPSAEEFRKGLSVPVVQPAQLAGTPATPQRLTSDIIRVPSAEELKRGARIEPLRPLDLAPIRPGEVSMPPTPEPLTSDLIKVPSAEELKKGARVEVLQPARERMQPAQFALPGITNAAVQKAIGKVSYSAFVLAEALTNAPRRTMESPYVVGYVAECLDPQPTDRVLQLGIGSGYEAAVLAELVQAVYSVEPRAETVQQARANLERCGYTNNVFVRQGELAAGWLDASPFDKMVFNGNPEQFPAALINQLRQGGRLVIASDEDNQVHVFERAGGGLAPTYCRPIGPASIRPREIGAPPMSRRIQRGPPG